tara:strand:- start:229 stop:402 length:174 start_codon:yes stop_codon:yes gene_type:complete
MIDILAGIGVIALVIGAGFFVNYMEGVAERRKEDRLEEFYKDEFGDDEDDFWEMKGL